MSTDAYSAFCYVCGALLANTPAREVLETNDERCRFPGQDFDLRPVTCDASTCIETYATLPKTKYSEDKVFWTSDITYDGGPFRGFPYRAEGHPGGRVESTHLGPIAGAFLPDQVPRLESLLQAWLFFGLLHETLGPYYNAKDYIGEDEDGIKILLLAPLVTTVSRLISATSRTPPEERDNAMLSRIDNALQVVHEELRATLYSSFNENLRSFIASAAEIIWQTMEYMYEPNSQNSVWATFGTEDSASHLVSVGWCPHEAQNTMNISVHLATRFLLYQIKKPVHGFRHDWCSESECVATRSIPGPITYSHRGTCQGDECSLVRLNDDQIQHMCSILEQGNFPLLQISTDETGSIFVSVVPYDKGIPYVAISHVCIQGLGNEEDNGLGACQLQYLYRRVRELASVLGPGRDGRSVMIWLDTFCCPVRSRADQKFRKRAILKMQEVYQVATCVLVIDTEMEAYNLLQHSVVDIATRILTSTWMQRLWTLQEGSLPDELWFQLNDRAINAHSLFLAIRHVYSGYDIRERLLSRVVLRDFHQLRRASGRYQFISRDQEFSYLFSGVAKRKVMHQRDEAICIATLLKFDLTSIIVSDVHTERMQAWWRQASAHGLIPRNMAFARGQKLESPGFRWAYSTFLQPTTPEVFDTNATLKGMITGNGLRIEGVGMTVKLASPLKGFDITHYLPHQPTTQTIDVNQNNHWRRFYIHDVSTRGRLDGPHTAEPFTLTKFLRRDLLTPDKTFALVKQYHPRNTASINDGTHLLVEVTGTSTDTDGSTLLCQSLCKGYLAEMLDSERASVTLASFQADAMRESKPEIIRALEALSDLPATEERRLKAKQLHEALVPQLTFNQSLIDGRTGVPNDVRALGPDPVFPLRVALMLAGNYAVCGDEFPASQLWCID